MIIAVTGLSAAGKTTWCRRHHPDDLIGEYVPTGAEPDDRLDLAAQAAYWCDVNCRRWQQAEARERISGLAVCDEDPLKLHYSWSLARTGATSRQRWMEEVIVSREAVAARRLGFADAVLVCIPTADELQRHRDGDPIRRRRNFPLHARLREPLREWYETLDRLQPGRVFWELPSGSDPGVRAQAGTDRYSVTLFDTLIEALPVASGRVPDDQFGR